MKRRHDTRENGLSYWNLLSQLDVTTQSQLQRVAEIGCVSYAPYAKYTERVREQQQA